MEKSESDIIKPDRWISIKDSLGFHKVRVYNSIKGLRLILEKRYLAQKINQDSIYLVCGLEGTGKSNTTLWAADIYSNISGREVPLENITRNIAELQARIAELKSQDFLTMDEGAELDGTRYQEKQAKELKEYFTVMRKAGFIIFLCFTNPLKVATYFREDRVRGVFFIKKQGVAYYYANSPENPHFTEILERWGKDNDTRSIRLFTQYAPDFIMYFPEYKGKLREEYERRKDENIQAVFSKFGKTLETSKLLTYEEAAKVIGCHKKSIGSWVHQKRLNSVLDGIRPKILLEEAERFRDELLLKKYPNKFVKSPLPDSNAAHHGQEIFSQPN